LPTVLLQDSLHRCREIQQKMESVRYLLRLRSPKRSAFSIQAATVPCDGHVRIPVKWGTDSGDVGQRRSEATLVTDIISEVPHLRQEFLRS